MLNNQRIRMIDRRHQPLLRMDGLVLTYHYGSICLLDLETYKFRKLSNLPCSRVKRLLSHVRLLERLFRIEVRAVAKLPDNNALLSFNGALYHLDVKKGLLTEELRFRNGMRDPLGLTRIEGIDGFDDCTVFGEYIPNRERSHDIALYMRKDKTGQWEQCYLFENGQVKHVHNIVADRKNQKVYVLTGDYDEESGVWEARKNFADLTPVLTGSQQYRAVRMFPVNKSLIYATDSALEQNKVFLARADDGGSFILRELCELSGSCIYAAETKSYLVFATTVEPDERLHGMKLLFSCKPGPSIKDDKARLVSINKNDLTSKVLLECKKDRLPYILFQYGGYRLLGLEETDELLIYPVGVKKYDGKLLKMDLV